MPDSWPPGSELFVNLNATGTRFFGPANCSDATFVLSSLSTSAAGALDGIFSFRITVTAGSVQLNPSAYGFFPDRSQTSPAFATVATAPEPASMLLVGTGLLCAGVPRWRQKRTEHVAGLHWRRVIATANEVFSDTIPASVM